MDRAIKLIAGATVVLFAAGLVSLLLRGPQTMDNTINNIPPLTSEQYLRAIDNRYPDNQLVHCVYANLLDKYGVQEVVRLDTLGLSDPDNQEIVSKLTESTQECQ